MLFEKIDTGCLNFEETPWIPFAPYSTDVMIKYFKIDPVHGETVTLLKAPAGTQMPRHHHSGTVIVYTVKGAWKYAEHDWVAREGSVVYETASSRHTPEVMPDSGEVITFNIVKGDLLYLDANDQIIAVENWKTSMERYLGYCRDNGITPRDVSSFAM